MGKILKTIVINSFDILLAASFIFVLLLPIWPIKWHWLLILLYFVFGVIMGIWHRKKRIGKDNPFF